MVKDEEYAFSVVSSWLTEQGLPLSQTSCSSGMTESSLIMKSATGNLVCHRFRSVCSLFE